MVYWSSFTSNQHPLECLWPLGTTSHFLSSTSFFGLLFHSRVVYVLVPSCKCSATLVEFANSCRMASSNKLLLHFAVSSIGFFHQADWLYSVLAATALPNFMLVCVFFDELVLFGPSSLSPDLPIVFSLFSFLPPQQLHALCMHFQMNWQQCIWWEQENQSIEKVTNINLPMLGQSPHGLFLLLNGSNHWWKTLNVKLQIYDKHLQHWST